MPHAVLGLARAMPRAFVKERFENLRLDSGVILIPVSTENTT